MVSCKFVVAFLFRLGAFLRAGGEFLETPPGAFLRAGGEFQGVSVSGM